MEFRRVKQIKLACKELDEKAMSMTLSSSGYSAQAQQGYGESWLHSISVIAQTLYTQILQKHTEKARLYIRLYDDAGEIEEVIIEHATTLSSLWKGLLWLPVCLTLQPLTWDTITKSGSSTLVLEGNHYTVKHKDRVVQLYIRIASSSSPSTNRTILCMVFGGACVCLEKSQHYNFMNIMLSLLHCLLGCDSAPPTLEYHIGDWEQFINCSSWQKVADHLGNLFP